jgi:aryl-alcohol dehydrogenase-like predicted oxidoreductase
MAVRRLGFGAMRLVGPNIWGHPEDRDNPVRLLNRAIELGVNLLDTAEAYGPELNELQIHDALAPYPADLVIATKCGLHRHWPEGARYPQRAFKGSPAAIRASTEGSLQRLGVERIDLQQLHRIDPDVPIEESVGALEELRREGKIRHIGLSEVSIDEIERARSVASIASVQNKYSVTERQHEQVLRHCEAARIAFMPWAPIGGPRSEGAAPTLQEIADRYGATVAQISLAWLLARSPAILLIPGTASQKHLEENVASRDLALTPLDLAALDEPAASFV